MAENRILPPKLSSMSFEDWQKEIEIWQLVTNIPKKNKEQLYFNPWKVRQGNAAEL